MKSVYLSVFCAMCMSVSVSAQRDTVIPFEKAYKRVYRIAKTDGSRPVMDGRIDEDFWTATGDWTEDFVQVMPYERRPSPSPTRARLAYDDKYIYVAVYCKDSEPDRTIRFIGNRDDNMVGDLVSIAFDTYHDYRAAPEFNINAGGNRTDLIVTDKLSVNRSWNAVWEGRTHVDAADSSWTAELRIPFSQLRYSRRSGDGLWGLHIRRVIRRNNEVQNWSMIPLKNSGHVFSFGVMEGMDDLPKPGGIEIVPYVMGKYRREPQAAGNPYRRGRMWERNAGVDIKFGLSDFTLDLTVNPDFGQIELDPSVMNLTAYETFYDEKRPFFLEGKHILDFAGGGDMMFYTRRIGAAPGYTPEVDNMTSFAETKGNTPILGALKLTGSNRHGVTVGAIQSLTARSTARVTRDGAESRETVEPAANYTVARVQKNWKGNTLLGGMITSVNRFTEQSHLKDLLVRNAFTAGIDFTHYFGNRLYYVDMKGMFSSLDGSREAIERLQNSPVHYFGRRSAAGWLGTDPTRTSLRGTGGYIQAGRKGNDKWAFSENFGWSSPGFDLNDAGYLKQADILQNTSEIQFRRTDIWTIFRSNTVTLTQNNRWDYGGTPFLNTVGLTWKTMFLNRFELTATETFTLNRLDSRKLRGGPDLRYDPGYTTALAFNTDRARRAVFTLTCLNTHSTNKIDREQTVAPGVAFRMGNRVHLAGEFSYSHNTDNTQYVPYSASSPLPSVYREPLMGRMEQKTCGLTMKLQVNVTPDISLQFYGAPFTSTARYSDFKQAADTRSHTPGERFLLFAPEEISCRDGVYTVTDRNGQLAYRFADPDFNFNEFRSNLVARWEYMPGSTLYFVWEHRLSDRQNRYLPAWDDNLQRML
ncbi:MAG: carbohydrate binding family 9 domain-containing protein, partial [Tannerella sp.]|nr:carbohydrate binding family 9 domain-containing protein [Tannerella sp.]